MKKYIIVLLLVSAASHAADFSAREAAGKAALTTPEGQKYEATWGPVMQAVISICIPAGSTSPENLGAFTFVADVSMSGQVSNVAVKPLTRVSGCFAQHFTGSKLPPPPAKLKSGESFPVTDKMKIAP